MIYDKIQITIPSSENLPWPVLSFNPSDKNILYFRHAAGIHQIFVPWISEIIEYQEDETLPELSSTQVDYLFNTMPIKLSEPNPIVGFTVVDDPFLGYFIFCIETNWQTKCFELSHKTFKNLEDISEKAISSISISHPAMTPFQVDLENLKKSQPVLTMVSARNKTGLSNFASQDALEFFMEATKSGQSYILWLIKMNALVKYRYEILEKTFGQNVEDLTQLKRITQIILTLHKEAEEQREKINKKQEEQMKRIALITRNLQKTEQNVQSKAEQQFRRFLEEKDQALPWIQSKIEESEKKLSLYSKKKTTNLISERHSKNIFEALRQQ